MKQSIPVRTLRSLGLLVLVAVLASLTPPLLPTRNVAHAQQALPAPALTATPAGATAIELSWQPVAGAAGYELWAWWDAGTDWQRLDDGTLTATAYTHEGLTAGTTYYYQMRALDANGAAGAWSQRVPATAGAPLPTSTLSAPALTAQPSAGAIELRWTEVAGAARYELWAWWDAHSDWQRISDSLTGTTYSHTGLTAATTYYYQMRTLDANGTGGAWSQRVSATVPAASGTPLPTPTPTLTPTPTSLSASPLPPPPPPSIWIPTTANI